jgi:hypothetical protein
MTLLYEKFRGDINSSSQETYLILPENQENHEADFQHSAAPKAQQATHEMRAGDRKGQARGL